MAICDNLRGSVELSDADLEYIYPRLVEVWERIYATLSDEQKLAKRVFLRAPVKDERSEER